MDKLERMVNWLKAQIDNTAEQEEVIQLSVNAKNGCVVSISTFQMDLTEDEEKEPKECKHNWITVHGIGTCASCGAAYEDQE